MPQPAPVPRPALPFCFSGGVLKASGRKRFSIWILEKEGADFFLRAKNGAELAQDLPVRVEQASAGELVFLIVAFGEGGSRGVVKCDGAIEFSVLKLPGGGELAIWIVTLVSTVFFTRKVRSNRAGCPFGIKLANASVELILFPVFFRKKVALFVPRASSPFLFSEMIKGFRFFHAGREVFNAQAIELSVFPERGVAGKTIGPPARGGAVQLITGIKKVVGD